MEGSISKPSEKMVALVNGGNRGMGFEICRQLASSGLIVVLTARNEKRGDEAVDKLRGLGLGLPDVVFHQLEITELESAARLADFVRDKFGKLDILVNNAAIFGVTMDVGDQAALRETLAGKDQNEIAEWLRRRSTQNTQQAECLKTNYHPKMSQKLCFHSSNPPAMEGSSMSLSVWATQVFQRRGAQAGAQQRRHPDQAEAGRAVGAVHRGLQERRAGDPRVADRPGVLGVLGVQGARLRVHEDPGEGERRAAGQLRAPGLRRDRDELQHREPDGRGRRQRLRRGRSRRGGRRDRCLL